MTRRHSPLCRRIWPRQLFQLPLLALLTLLASACQESSPPQPEPKPDSAATETSPTAGPLAQTRYGPVRGYREDGVLVFKGIRYGADTATTRFAAPAPPDPWTEPQDATTYGNSARQVPIGSGGGLFASWAANPAPALSEDCLFLNVWTPALNDDGKRPVLVWLHGGGFTSGSGSSNAYDGVRLVNRGDVVVVTVNHRLNVFGYLHLDDWGDAFAGSGNAGMLDLVAALAWVHDNITSFGGDPDNVMIFGESGGGAKVSVLMAMDAARGLFHRAVVQSGPALTLAEAPAAAAGAAALVTELGLTGETIDEIRDLPPEKIEDAARAVAATGVQPTWTRPVLDGMALTRHPFDPDAPAQSADVPLLIGTTRSEMSLLAGARRPELFDLTWETLPAALSESLPGADPAMIITGYKALRPTITAPQLYFEATTDNGFLRRSITLADRKADQHAAPVYFYLFNWDTPVDDGKWGAPHALEIGFVFDNVARSESMSGTGEAQQAIADMMSEAWLAFARSGDPNHPGLPEWLPYDSTSRATMVFDDTPALINHPRGAQLDLLVSD